MALRNANDERDLAQLRRPGRPQSSLSSDRRLEPFPRLSPPTPVYEANTTIPAKNGATQAVHVSVQSWAISGQGQEIPLQGFYVAHLLSGQILATIDGQTTQHLPGDYWTVNAGAAMRVKTGGEVAVLETTVVSKQ